MFLLDKDFNRPEFVLSVYYDYWGGVYAIMNLSCNHCICYTVMLSKELLHSSKTQSTVSWYLNDVERTVRNGISIDPNVAVRALETIRTALFLIFAVTFLENLTLHGVHCWCKNICTCCESGYKITSMARQHIVYLFPILD